MKILSVKLIELIAVMLVVAALVTPSMARAPDMLNGPSTVGIEGDPTGGVIGFDGEISSGGDSDLPNPVVSGLKPELHWIIGSQYSNFWPPLVLPIPLLPIAENLHPELRTAGGISRCQ